MSSQPPRPFLVAEVTGREWLSPRLVLVSLQGRELRGLDTPQPAASVRVLLPEAGVLEIPDWDGSRFVAPGGGRPALRTLTPLHHHPGGDRMDLCVVVHGEGLASRWAASVEESSTVALSGPARGYLPEPDAKTLILGGDETAYPAICSIIETVATEARVYLEAEDGSRPPLPPHPRCHAEWVAPVPSAPGRAVAEALSGMELGDGVQLWAAGEAAAMQSLRRELFDVRGVPRHRAVVRGYWKHGRGAEAAGG